MSRPVIYILDDDPVFAGILKGNMGKAGEFDVQTFEDPEDCLAALAEAPPDVLLTDLYMEGMNGVEVSQAVRATNPYLPIFVLTARGELDTAVEAMKAGANEYLQKPVNVGELTSLIRQALRVRPLIREATALRKDHRERYAVDALLGDHPLMDETRAFLQQVAGVRSVSVLLLGESGVGKNLAARAIHYADTSAQGQFVEINCAALPEHLLEAELFGYMKGAFTDARENKPGLVETADGGTLFLDEIAEMPAGLQAKLLNFLESRRYRRLGGTRDRTVDVRIVAATNRNIDEQRARGDFREDLFYRISAASHVLPSLREIPEVIPELARHFAESIGEEMGKPVDGFTEPALQRLQEWHWPGNARELRNVVERAVLFASAPTLDLADLPALDSSPGRHVDERDDRFRLSAGLTLKEAEAEYIRLTLERMDGRIQDSADVLGISRKNLWEKRKKYGLAD